MSKLAFAVVSLIASLSACDGGVSSPTSATPTPSTTYTLPGAVSDVSYVLSGVVFEITAAGPVPIEGVEVYCDSCGSPVGHTFVYTDAKGSYSLAWAMNGVHPLFVRRTGYEIFDPTGKLRDQYGRISATVRGDTRFDIELVRR